VSPDLVIQLALTGVALGAIYALVAVGLTIVFGLLRIINFAHAQFLMLGAFLGLALYQRGVPYLAVLLVAPAMFGALSLLIDRGIIRPLLRSKSFQADTLLATLGLGLVLENGAQAAWGAQPYYFSPPPFPGVLPVGSAFLPTQSAVTVAVAAAVFATLWVFLHRTRLGTAVRATAQSRETAALVGVETERVLGLAFAVGSGLAALGGILLGTLYSTNFAMGSSLIVVAFIIVILGGPGHIPGALVASLVIGVTEAVAGGLVNPRFQRLVVMLVFLGVLMLRPQGLFGRPVGDAP